MDISEEYRDRVESIGESTEKLISRKRAFRVKGFLDQILPFALLSLTFVVIFGFFISVTEQMRVYVTYLNWGVIVYFAARLTIEFRLSNHREKFVQNHWLDFILVIPAFSVLKQAKAIDALREIKLFEEETLISAAFFKELGISAQLTKTVKIIKRSIGL